MLEGSRLVGRTAQTTESVAHRNRVGREVASLGTVDISNNILECRLRNMPSWRGLQKRLVLEAGRLWHVPASFLQFRLVERPIAPTETGPLTHCAAAAPTNALARPPPLPHSYTTPAA